MTTVNRTQKRNLIPLTRWSKHYDWPSAAGLRHLIVNAQKNGFNKVFRKIGRKILIDETEFFVWVDSQAVTRSTTA